MSDMVRPSYEELGARLAEAEGILDALRGHEVDAVLGEKQIAFVRLQEAEEALRRATLQLRDVLGSIRDAFLAVDTDWDITYVNEPAAEMAGTGIQGLIGRNLWDVFPGMRDSSIRELCEQVLAEGEPAHAGLRLPDGSWLSVSAYPSSSGLSIHWRDITASKEVEQEREAQRQLMEKLIQFAPLGVAVVDAGGRFLMANPAMEGFLIAEERSIVGRKLHEVFPQSLVQPALDMLDRVLRAGESLQLEDHEVAGEEGRRNTFWNAQIIPLTDTGDTADGVLLLVEDVTEAALARREVDRLAEETQGHLSRLEAVLESVDQGLLIFEPEGTLVMSNPAAVKALPPADTGTLQTLPKMMDALETRLLTGELVPPEELPWRRVVRGERFSEMLRKITLKGSDGAYICSIGGAPVYDEDGELILGILTLRDVTERVEMEEELRRLNEELEQTVEERTKVAERRASLLQSMASTLLQAEQRERRRLSDLLHDHLQQIITAAQMRAQLLGGHVDDEQAQAMLAELGDLLGEAVEASRSLAVELSPPVLAHGLSAALRWLADQKMSKHHLRVGLEIEGDIETHSDELNAFLLQAAAELLFNAVKHAGVAETTMRAWRDDDCLILEVSDNGKGFDPERLAAEDNPEREGSGLLSIRRRLELLGGKMEIESSPGTGTTFRLHAPVRSVSKAPVPRRPAQERLRLISGGAPGAAGEDLRVMVVDDHDIVREGLVGLLSDYPDMEIVGEACDGETAVAMAKKLRPNVIIMDVSMPGMNGIEATRRIVNDLPEVRIIGLSMHEERDVAEQMQAAGASAFVTKGGPYEQLIAAIRGREDEDEDG